MVGREGVDMPIERIWLQVHDAEVRADEREKAIDECIKIIEETVWKDAEMLVENIREFTKEGGK